MNFQLREIFESREGNIVEPRGVVYTGSEFYLNRFVENGRRWRAALFALSSAQASSYAPHLRPLSLRSLEVLRKEPGEASNERETPLTLLMTDKDYFSLVTTLLGVESAAIAETARRIERAEVERAVEILASCRGKVVVVGVGKSGIIAQKIAATMTSTGTAAVHLHPSDALHGGLGIVAPDDVVVALSNSGETDEIVAMLPHLKHRNVPIIAVVGNLCSTLARGADVRLDASVDQEACPLNMAPTTSTTVALAIGDALAIVLMQVKGLTTDDFAQNHPAGRLGKRLTLRVADLMHAGADHPTVKRDAPWLEVIAAITRGGLGAVSVVDDEGHLLGIITDGDLRRTIQNIKHAELETLTGSSFMTRNPVVARPDLMAYDALRLMEDRPRQISILPVVTEARVCVGLIRLHDIVRSGL